MKESATIEGVRAIVPQEIFDEMVQLGGEPYNNLFDWVELVSVRVFDSVEPILVINNAFGDPEVDIRKDKPSHMFENVMVCGEYYGLYDLLFQTLYVFPVEGITANLANIINVTIKTKEDYLQHIAVDELKSRAELRDLEAWDEISKSIKD